MHEAAPVPAPFPTSRVFLLRVSLLASAAAALVLLWSPWSLSGDSRTGDGTSLFASVAWHQSPATDAFWDGVSLGMAASTSGSYLGAGASFGSGGSSAALSWGSGSRWAPAAGPHYRSRARLHQIEYYCWDFYWDPWYGYWPYCDTVTWVTWRPPRRYWHAPAVFYYPYYPSAVVWTPYYGHGWSFSFSVGAGWGWYGYHSYAFYRPAARLYYEPWYGYRWRPRSVYVVHPGPWAPRPPPAVRVVHRGTGVVTPTGYKEDPRVASSGVRRPAVARDRAGTASPQAAPRPDLRTNPSARTAVRTGADGRTAAAPRSDANNANTRGEPATRSGADTRSGTEGRPTAGVRTGTDPRAGADVRTATPARSGADRPATRSTRVIPTAPNRPAGSDRQGARESATVRPDASRPTIPPTGARGSDQGPRNAAPPVRNERSPATAPERNVGQQPTSAGRPQTAPRPTAAPRGTAPQAAPRSNAPPTARTAPPEARGSAPPARTQPPQAGSRPSGPAVRGASPPQAGTRPSSPPVRSAPAPTAGSRPGASTQSRPQSSPSRPQASPSRPQASPSRPPAAPRPGAPSAQSRPQAAPRPNSPAAQSRPQAAPRPSAPSGSRPSAPAASTRSTRPSSVPSANRSSRPSNNRPAPRPRGGGS
jgi:hypothetical protein